MRKGKELQMPLYFHAALCEFQRNVIKYTLIVGIKEKPVFLGVFYYLSF